MEMIFFTSLLLVVYTYALFPLAMAVLGVCRQVGWQRSALRLPLTIIISVYNEENVIREKIDNSLALEYDADLLEILVVSDGSTDATNAIVQSYDDPRVRLLVCEGRLGKTECLNRAVPQAKGELIVFTDANSMFPADVLNNISRNFVDDRIGLVTGWTRYRDAGGREVSSGFYAKLEKMTKYGESLVSSCVGADGAIFAIRKKLYRRLEVFDINDFVIPLHVIASGRRVVLDPDIFCFEPASGQPDKEFRRQARITNRTLGALWRGRRFLNPLLYGSFSFFLLSHKWIRFISPFFLAACLLISLANVTSGGHYALYFVLQVMLLVFVLLGRSGLVQGRAVQFVTYFTILMSAQAVGWYRFLFGKPDTVWNPQR